MGPIHTFPGVLSPEECGVLIELGESAGFSPAPIEGWFDGPRGFLVRGGRDKGGETYFFDSEEIVMPQAGKVLIFSHGLWHAGRTVTAGRKYVLRTDVMYAPAARVTQL